MCPPSVLSSQALLCVNAALMSKVTVVLSHVFPWRQAAHPQRVTVTCRGEAVEPLSSNDDKFMHLAESGRLPKAKTRVHQCVLSCFLSCTSLCRRVEASVRIDLQLLTMQRGSQRLQYYCCSVSSDIDQTDTIRIHHCVYYVLLLQMHILLHHFPFACGLCIP